MGKPFNFPAMRNDQAHSVQIGVKRPCSEKSLDLESSTKRLKTSPDEPESKPCNCRQS
jgi:hypothetical protein